MVGERSCQGHSVGCNLHNSLLTHIYFGHQLKSGRATCKNSALPVISDFSLIISLENVSMAAKAYLMKHNGLILQKMRR